ncbi:7916_t:CDS:10, partial [Dentiscutata heterogama]
LGNQNMMLQKRSSIASWVSYVDMSSTPSRKTICTEVHKDASNIGGGATFKNYFTAFKWANQIVIADHDIQESNAEAYYSGFCRNPQINRIIAQIYETQIQGNFSIKLEHIPGKQNRDADLLSLSGHKEYLFKHPAAQYLQPDVPPEYANAISLIPSLLTYEAIIRRYQTLADKQHWRNEDGSVSPPTISSYLSALKFHHSRNSYDWAPVRNDGNSENDRCKSQTQTNDLLFWSVALTAFYRLAQLGELLPDRKLDGSKVPQLQALRFEYTNSGTFTTVQLARTKKHKAEIRSTLIINPTKDNLCPIKSLKATSFDAPAHPMHPTMGYCSTARRKQITHKIGSKITIKEYNKFLERQESSSYKYQRRDNGDVFVIDMSGYEHDLVVTLLQDYFKVPNNTIIDPPIIVGSDTFHYSPSGTGELIAADVSVYPNRNHVQQSRAPYPGLLQEIQKIICEVGNHQTTANWNAKCQLWINQVYVRFVLGIKLHKKRTTRDGQGRYHISMAARLWQQGVA